MPHVEAGAPELRRKVLAVLRVVRVAGAGEEPRRVVLGPGERVGAQHRDALHAALLELELQAVVFGSARRLEDRDVPEEGIRTQVRRHRARSRLIQVAARDQRRASGSDIRSFHAARGAELALHADAEVLQVRRLQVLLKRETRLRRRNRVVLRERIVERQRWQPLRGEEEVEVEVRVAEIQPFRGRQRRLVVVDAIGTAYDRLGCGRPRKAQTRREVVVVRVVSSPRHSARADLDQAAGGLVVHGRAVLGVHGRRGQLVSQAGRQRQGAGRAPLILDEQPEVLGAKALWVVERGADGDRRQAKQEIRQPIAGVGKRGERQLSSRLDVAEGILPHRAQIEPALDQVGAGAPRERVDELEGVGDALLRVVVFLPDRRVAGDRDEAQAPVTRVGRQLRQADLPVDAGALAFLVHLVGNARVAETRLVQQARRDHAHAGRHQILPATIQGVAVAGHERES